MAFSVGSNSRGPKRLRVPEHRGATRFPSTSCCLRSPRRSSVIRENKGLSFKRVPSAFVILDGQHRMWGYQMCAARHRIPVAIYEGLSRADEFDCSSISTPSTKAFPRR